MAHEVQQKLVKWLKTAHAMERQIVETLQKHEQDAENMPEVQSRIQQHRDESERHAELIAKCLDTFGEDTSTWKDISAKIGGNMSGMFTDLVDNDMLANSIADYATEHVEIAFYKSIKLAAQQEGEDEVVRACDEILQDEEEMAKWLEDNHKMVVEKALQA